MPKIKYKVILFYKFVRIRNPKVFVKEQRKLCLALNLQGRMLVAKEGINATFEGKEKDIEKYKKALRKNQLFQRLVFKESVGNGKAFTRLEIKIRDEIVTLEAGNLNVKKDTAKAITAKELEKFYNTSKDFIVLDLRNDFEIQAGHFEKTFNPKLKNFRDLPKKLSKLKKLKNKTIVTVCTGGIRCEKATCLLKKEGFKDLYQLKDGIHTYMQKYPGKRFKGTLFVFDNRMTTPVVNFKQREIIGRCLYCESPCEEFYNDDSIRPSVKVICCRACVNKHPNKLRQCVSKLV